MFCGQSLSGGANSRVVMWCNFSLMQFPSRRFESYSRQVYYKFIYYSVNMKMLRLLPWFDHESLNGRRKQLAASQYQLHRVRPDFGRYTSREQMVRTGGSAWKIGCWNRETNLHWARSLQISRHTQNRGVRMWLCKTTDAKFYWRIQDDRAHTSLAEQLLNRVINMLSQRK